MTDYTALAEQALCAAAAAELKAVEDLHYANQADVAATYEAAVQVDAPCLTPEWHTFVSRFLKSVAGSEAAAGLSYRLRAFFEAVPTPATLQAWLDTPADHQIRVPSSGACMPVDWVYTDNGTFCIPLGADLLKTDPRTAATWAAREILAQAETKRRIATDVMAQAEQRVIQDAALAARTEAIRKGTALIRSVLVLALTVGVSTEDTLLARFDAGVMPSGEWRHLLAELLLPSTDAARVQISVRRVAQLETISYMDPVQWQRLISLCTRLGIDAPGSSVTEGFVRLLDVRFQVVIALGLHKTHSGDFPLFSIRFSVPSDKFLAPGGESLYTLIGTKAVGLVAAHDE